MITDILLQAMDEISDEYIEQAVNYKAETKAKKYKAFLPIAACVILALVSVLAFGKMNVSELKKESTVAQTFEATEAMNALITQDTEVSGETIQAIGEDTEQYTASEQGNSTEICVTRLTWEKSPYSTCYTELHFENEAYSPYNGALIGEDLLSGLIGQVGLIAEDENGKEHTVNADVFEIKNVDKKDFVALLFKDGVQKDYCAHGYYVYINKSFAPEMLGDVIERLHFSEYLVLNHDIYHESSCDTEFATMTYYRSDAEMSKMLISLLENNKHIPTEHKDYDSMYGKEHIKLSARHLGNNIRFIINSDGYLYVAAVSGFLGYNVGTEAFESFKSYLTTAENIGDISETRDLLVATTTVAITSSTAYIP